MAPYERIVQWVAGPFAGVIGVLAVKATDHLSFLGQVGLGKNAIAHAIQNAVVFGATALVTYAAHHKWLGNLATWWSTPSNPTAVTGWTAPVTAEAPVETTDAPPPPPPLNQSSTESDGQGWPSNTPEVKSA